MTWGIGSAIEFSCPSYLGRSCVLSRKEFTTLGKNIIHHLKSKSFYLLLEKDVDVVDVLAAQHLCCSCIIRHRLFGNKYPSL